MLSFLLLIPLVGVLAMPLMDSPKACRNLATATSAATLVLAGYLLTQLDLGDLGLQWSQSLPWLDLIGLNYTIGVDGLSLSLIVLNAFLTPIAIHSAAPVTQRPRLYYALMLLINAGITGALISQNLLLFVLFYDLELIPFYLLIAIWGGAQRNYAATKFLLYTAVSGLLVLGSFIAIGLLGGSLDYADLNTSQFGQTTQLLLLVTLVIAFSIKTPLVPLHTWMPDAYVEASPATAILLGGCFAKLGTYGLLRFCVELFPQVWPQIAPNLAIVGAISAIYGALTAIAQRDIKRMVAYSSIGHMGYILVALAAGNELSLLGAIAQMLSHGLVLAILFFLVGIIEAKTGTRDLDVLNGLMNPIRGLPLTSALLILSGMASAGIPGMVGFAAEIMVFQGSFAPLPIPTLLCILSSGLTAVYFVILINRTCFGRLDNTLAYYPSMSLGEQLPALILCGLIIFLGVQPYWLVHWIAPSAQAIITHLPQATAIAFGS